MKVVVTSKQMRECDRYAIEKLHIPGIILMENAGKGVVDAICSEFGLVEGKKFAIVCGKGNNGGDGFVVARHLHKLGAIINVILLGRYTDVKGDAKVNFEILRNLVKRKSESDRLVIKEISTESKLKKLEEADYVIDAIFGTGFKGETTGLPKQAIELMNKSGGKKIAIDIPSGLNADNGTARGMAFKANLTITMGFIKSGLSLAKSKNYTGVVQVVDLGLLGESLITKKPNTFCVTSKDVRKQIPLRSLTSHKYSYKKVYILAGSSGFTGAAAMAANSTLRTGGSLVVLGTPKSVYPILARKLNEIMVQPLEETDEGSISLNALKSIEEKLQWSDLLVLGPGLSKNPETQQLIEKIIRMTIKPILIDADGLAAIPISSTLWKSKSKRKLILTPHVGEFSRLINIPAKEIEECRIEITREYAVKLGVTLVLKGAPTVIGTNGGNIYVNSTGNPGMATAGTGDILSGIIAGLMAQKMDEQIAAYCGVFIHGLAGDLARHKYGERSLMAMDLVDCLPDAFRMIEKGVTVE